MLARYFILGTRANTVGVDCAIDERTEHISISQEILPGTATADAETLVRNGQALRTDETVTLQDLTRWACLVDMLLRMQETGYMPYWVLLKTAATSSSSRTITSVNAFFQQVARAIMGPNLNLYMRHFNSQRGPCQGCQGSLHGVQTGQVATRHADTIRSWAEASLRPTKPNPQSLLPCSRALSFRSSISWTIWSSTSSWLCQPSLPLSELGSESLASSPTSRIAALLVRRSFWAG
jgi:hypothetical protein